MSLSVCGLHEQLVFDLQTDVSTVSIAAGLTRAETVSGICSVFIKLKLPPVRQPLSAALPQVAVNNSALHSGTVAISTP